MGFALGGERSILGIHGGGWTEAPPHARAAGGALKSPQDDALKIFVEVCAVHIPLPFCLALSELICTRSEPNAGLVGCHLDKPFGPICELTHRRVGCNTSVECVI